MSTVLVPLSSSQRQHLLEATYLPPELRAVIVRAAQSTPASRATRLELDLGTAERFREAFTKRLAQVGFDRAYEPTEEGAVLEGLLDAFFASGER